MATIDQIVAQIRTAIYGRDVRENIAEGIEKCYTDVTTGSTLADAAAAAATEATANVNAAISEANMAANAANTAAENVGNAVSAANTAASNANTAAVKIDDMTTEAEELSPNQEPTATITEVEGHKHILFGIPKGNTGETPAFSIGSVQTVNPNQEAMVSIGGTDEEPIFNFMIPRGYDGSSVMSNRIWECDTAGGTANKTVSVTTPSFELEEGGLFIIKFTNKNTADSPTLNIGSTGAKNIFINGEQITTSYDKNLVSGVCLFIYDGVQYNLIGNFFNESAAAITDSEIDALFPKEGGE